MPTFLSKFNSLFPWGVKSTLLTSSVIILMQLITGVLLARLLGPQGRGQLAVCVIWPTVISSLGSLGIKDAIIFHTANKNFHDSSLFNIFFLACIQSAALMAIGYFLLPFFLKSQSPQILMHTRFFLLIIPFQLITYYLIAIAQANLQITFFNTLRFLIPVMNFMVGFFLFIFSIPSIPFILIGYISGNIIITIIYAFYTLRSHEFKLKLDAQYIKQLLAYGIRVHLGTVTHDLNQRFDQMLISVFLQPVMLGHYTVAATSTNVMNVIPNAFKTILFPSVSSTKDMTAAKNIISSYNFKCVCIVSVCTFILFLSLPYLIPLVYGRDFFPSVNLARILLFAVFFGAIRDILATAHRAMNNPLTATKAEIFGLIMTVILLSTLLPTYGVIGAAVASLCAYAVTAVYNIWMMIKLYDFRLHHLFLKINKKTLT